MAFSDCAELLLVRCR